ncbi:MAG: hypothetical protein NT027_08330 [Proteobacteria bacterium]|nr:hypothetical protein [Pseudomonadota bacterium]
MQDRFDRDDFKRQLTNLKPIRIDQFNVLDTYYVLKGQSGFVYRHRFDREIDQLTVKSVEKNSTIRQEINLNLIHSAGSQTEGIKAFLSTFGVEWSQCLKKDVLVAYYSDCEIVHYIATCENRTVHCVEFEAVGYSDVNAALQILSKYETKLGFDQSNPEEKSLFELLLIPTAPSHVVEMFRKVLKTK